MHIELKKIAARRREGRVLNGGVECSVRGLEDKGVAGLITGSSIRSKGRAGEGDAIKGLPAIVEDMERVENRAGEGRVRHRRRSSQAGEVGVALAEAADTRAVEPIDHNVIDC